MRESYGVKDIESDSERYRSEIKTWNHDREDIKRDRWTDRQRILM